MEQIPRNAEEQEAFEALLNTLGCLGDLDVIPIAENIERELLRRGFQIVKIEEIASLREVVDEHSAENRKSSSLGFFD